MGRALRWRARSLGWTGSSIVGVTRKQRVRGGGSYVEGKSGTDVGVWYSSRKKLEGIYKNDDAGRQLEGVRRPGWD